MPKYYNDPSDIYTVDYYIRKFEAIPESKWTIGQYESKDGKHWCALGLCGVREIRANALGEYDEEHTDESHHLIDLFLRADLPPVGAINDYSKRFDEPTPKRRILAALRYIKEKQCL